MFNSNLIMAVKVNGKVLREFDNTVALPFGSEYSIFIKNNSGRRASVDVTIDGQDVLDGTSIIVNANSSVELKRFIKNGNFETGNAFKFIEKTAAVEKFRGNKAEDGLLTIRYSFERELPQFNHYDIQYRARGICGSTSGSLLRNMSAAPQNATQYTNTTSFDVAFAAGDDADAIVPTSLQASMSTASTVTPAAKNDAGITAPGSVVEQQFRTVYGFIPDSIVHTMTLKMIGAIEGQSVEKPVTVKRKVQCTVCGTFCKQTAKFCHECSASVVIV